MKRKSKTDSTKKSVEPKKPAVGKKPASTKSGTKAK